MARAFLCVDTAVLPLWAGLFRADLRGAGVAGKPFAFGEPFDHRGEMLHCILCKPLIGAGLQEGADEDTAGVAGRAECRHDDAFLCWLADELCRRHGLNADNKFFTGMSNGGEMCYMIARTHPGVFNAIASIAGLTMKWIDESFPLKDPVPFMEVHGTADKTSMWEGDLSNSGGWGAYIAVPDAVDKMVKIDACKYLIHEYLPPLKEGSRTVVLHRWTGGVQAWKGGPECEVRLYEIRGGKHSWGLSDMDTCSAVWEFFQRYLR